MSHQKFTTFVYSSSRFIRGELAIAAMRGGGVGIVNAELEKDAGNIFKCLDSLERFGRNAPGQYGLKLSAIDQEILDRLAPCNPAWLIVDSAALDAFFASVNFEKIAVPNLLVECITGDVPDCVKKGCVDGIIIKGNESGGYVGEESSFILLQKWAKQTDMPLYIRGGMTPHVAAACHAMGAAGGVLDSQILLLEESPAAPSLQQLLGTLSGSETVAVGDGEKGFYFRVLNHPQLKAAKTFIAEDESCSPDALQKLVANYAIDWLEPKQGLLPVGHDVYFAESWRKQYGTVAAVLRAIDDAVASYAKIAAANPPLRPDSPLARVLGTKLPIVQGPMTRVSDTVPFAQAIADGGALPMIAFALLRGETITGLLDKTQEKLAGKPWGIGLLGFVPPALLEEQISAALPFKPGFAVIAGGRPDQVVALEAQGISSFLHLPSASLLAGFLKGGARRFIFEGRECGGHIGPLSSFVLWSAMIDRLLAELDATGIPGEDIQCLFAGGIHDAYSSALLQVMTAPLAARGVKIGVIMGSAYLFTKEIVETGAIVDQFQKVIVACEKTVTLETGPGHASRCAYTPFAHSFFEMRRDYKSQPDMPADRIREKLDDLILGTLRLAAKGLTRENDALVAIAPDKQRENGMYMLGQVALLRNDVITIDCLHNEVIDGARQLLEAAAARQAPQNEKVKASSPADIAIVGMSCALPGARDKETYWENILNKVNAITEIPGHRFDQRLYFDADRHAEDKIYSKWGGFLDDMPFDPSKYGITPKSIVSVDPMQLMALEVAQAALADAGFRHTEKERERTSVILGISGGAGDVGGQYGLRSELPRFAGELPAALAGQLPEWTEDTFAGILVNVVAGRIANRLDLGGANFTTDAACASSMAAIHQGVQELLSRNSDTVIVGGVDTVQGPFGYMCFSKTQALSPTGACNAFDKGADGIVISEGIGMLVLKRLADAERDGNRIYAVIKGVGTGSDGKAKGLSAPLPAGQLRAMRRAYEQAGFLPSTVRLFEAHGTGTVAGDTSELESTGTLLKESGGKPRQSVVGSVKTMIGHTKATAGVAGLIKAALALHHKVLPPHRGVKDPNPALTDKDMPLYLLDEAEPWLNAADHPRRAAASAFGFGGTNFHVVMEEYSGEYRAWKRTSPRSQWPSEMFIVSGKDKQELPGQLGRIKNILRQSPDIEPRDLASALAKSWDGEGETLFIVAENFEKLAAHIDAAVDYLDGKKSSLPLGAYYSATQTKGKLAVLFPGQGSQCTGMAREVFLQFPVCADILSDAERLLSRPFRERFCEDASLGGFIFPHGAYDQQEKDAATRILASTDVAQPVLGAVESGLWRLMTDFGLKADMLAGHSYGEFVALYAGGFLSFEDLMTISEARGRLIVDKAREAGAELGAMAAVKASREDVESALRGLQDVVIANHNAPQQIIISGSAQAIEKTSAILSQSGKSVVPLPVAAAFHSPFVEPARSSLAEVIDKTDWRNGDTVPVYSNNTAKPHDASRLKKAMADHLVNPVEFVAEIEAMYEDGARVFLELGPKPVLTRLVGNILGNRPHAAIAFDDKGGGLVGMLHAFAQLLSAGIRVDARKLFEGRGCLTIDLENINAAHRRPHMPKHAWLLNGSGARRATDPVRHIGVTLEQAQTLKMQKTSTNSIKNGGKKAMDDQDIRPGSAVAEAYFRLLERQLDNAREVALAALGSAPARTAEKAIRQRQPLPLPEAITLPAREKAEPKPVTMAAAPVKPVEQAPPALRVIPSEASTEEINEKKLKEISLSVVTEKTGYEADMIEFSQNLEADLGIDSIKRVDIIGGILDRLPESV
ncbi:MAG: beta-ketoacyl synthase N-terminal-like domain-containing protein, partial [Pseudomonadota bacterium]